MKLTIRRLLTLCLLLVVLTASCTLIAQDSQASTDEAPGLPPANPWTRLATWDNATVHDLVFPTAAVGFAAAELGQVWKTTDGGEHWLPIMNLGFPYYWYGVAALSVNDVVVSGHDNAGMAQLRWSHDGGSTWGPVINLGFHSLFRVRFANAMDGVGIDMGSTVFYTTNGGETAADWTAVPLKSVGFLGESFSLLPNLHVRAAGSRYCDSLDGGKVWSCVPPVDSPYDDAAFFLDDDYGWVGGGEISPQQVGWLQATTDGGQHWSGRTLNSAWPVREIRFVDQQNGWAVGGNWLREIGGIYSSKDGGHTWSLDLQDVYEMTSCTQVPAQAGKVRVLCVGFKQGGSVLFAQTVPR